MNIPELLAKLQQAAMHDEKIKEGFLKTRQSDFPLKAFCEYIRTLGYEVYPMEIIAAGEENYAAMKRSTNGGGENIGEGSMVCLPVSGSCISDTKIGNNVFINSGALVMGRGGITIEDGVMVAANAQLISNNHDPYDLQVLTCKPVLIREGAWIGAGATILPGVCVGKHAVVGAAAVVTKDVPDYAVVGGNPARVIKYLDAERFEKDDGPERRI